MQINPHEIHIWTEHLAIPPLQEKEAFTLLNEEEKTRAMRFHFPKHQRRFTAARSALRKILALYLEVPPKDIAFAYTAHKKPYLQHPKASCIQFNLAHSHEIAIYAITLNHQVGIDIEKTQDHYDEALVKRYFSPQENEAFKQLSDQEKILAFYRVWSRKEALIKATGKGLFIPLPTFSVSVQNDKEVVILENKNWSLLPLSIHPEYQSALASDQSIESLSYWHFFDHQPILDKVLKI